MDQGINFFDTANSYSAGTSESIVGKLLKEYTRRDEIVIATKVFYPANMWEDATKPNEKGLSRETIMTKIDASLKRLGCSSPSNCMHRKLRCAEPAELS